ncbi:hypothetical protein V8G54_004508 [Vigna mungo]|uniref:Uncharacterized protein n=1 Tax=Vigna mungo TaxID=3915 RepID=A0AAQ3PFM2_VIGMU
MFATNAATNLFFPCKPSSFRCRAAAGDISPGPSFFQSVAGGLRLGPFPDGGGLAAEGRRVGGNEPIRVKKWSRKNESYLDNDNEPLPLPMTYPDSSPVSSEEIDRRLQCDPEVQATVTHDHPNFNWSNSTSSQDKFVIITTIIIITIIIIIITLFNFKFDFAGVAKDQDMLATMAREGKRLPANAFLAWELGQLGSGKRGGEYQNQQMPPKKMEAKILSLEIRMDKFKATLEKLVSLLTHNKCSDSSKEEDGDNMMGFPEMKKLFEDLFQGVRFLDRGHTFLVGYILSWNNFQTLDVTGYVQKITARKDIDVMENLDNGKPP